MGMMLIARRGIFIVGRLFVGCVINCRSWRSKVLWIVTKKSAVIADNCGGVGTVAQLGVV